jgi:hypothetical protein
MWYKVSNRGDSPENKEGKMTSETRTDITICEDASCDYLACLIARRDLATDALRRALPFEQPAAFVKYVDLARAVRRAEESEARFMADLDRMMAERAEVVA